MKKIAEDIMIPYVCTKNHNHFGAFFAPFYPTENQNFEKIKKKHIEILPFYIFILYIMIICCMVPEIWSTMDKSFCHFRSFFAL